MSLFSCLQVSSPMVLLRRLSLDIVGLPPELNYHIILADFVKYFFNNRNMQTIHCISYSIPACLPFQFLKISHFHGGIFSKKSTLFKINFCCTFKFHNLKKVKLLILSSEKKNSSLEEKVKELLNIINAKKEDSPADQNLEEILQKKVPLNTYSVLKL